ncbi:uncharacterized protein EV422DRAFT_246756 [Fimicolochytrium jonesii]|uniref:uncharacterized protein n=1 Tax=Fimicolochytrium jonesii TaxID=1396493 RepID=UPI0022FE3733|nr:uncharacterized protein EV422DRAFT_246756 [Fimicolochytrium jonesii]KAI8825121.1 hypothetical protein EV422DRAFT_246756 [Fimicolochytrium jonesii]
MLGNSDVRHGLTTTFPNLTGKNLSLNACAAGNSTTAVLTTEQVFDLSRPQTEAACEAAYGKESFTGMLRLAYARLISSFVGEQEVGFYITESDGGPEGHAAIRVQFDARSSNAQMSGRLQHGGCVPDPAVVTDCMLSIDLDGRQAESALDTEMRDGCQFHLHICASESNDLITFRLAYRATLFPEAFARDILAQYEQILCWLIAHPQTSCLAHVDYSRIPTRGLSILNPTPVEHTSKNAVQVWPTLLHQLVERQAELHPKRVALEFLHSLEDNSRTLLTYAELNDRSNQLARHLVSYGVSSDDKIPLCMDRSPNMYIVVLAILKAGCAFVPLASDLPIDRFGYVVREVGPKLIIIDGSAPRAALQKNVIGSVPILDIESNFVDDMRSALPSGNLKVSVAANNLAYILLTSGSTGVPKLVQIEHKAAVESILSHHAIVSHDETSVMLAVSSYTFDVSVFDMFFPLSTGIRLVSSSKELLLSNLEEVINSNGITLMEMTPTVAGMLSRQAVPGIKLLLTIGEMLTRKVVDEWAPGGCLLPLYGPTECTIHCTYAPNFLPDTKPTDIGVPMDTCSMYVMPQQLDEAKPICLDALPIGHVGELYVGGHQIARGYLNRPEANAKSYFNDPYSGGGRIYRTGDLVRMLPKGTLEIIGRVSNDSQVKLRGQRIELLDISHQVQSAHERIEDVLTVVVADEEGAGGKLLVSYLVCGAKHGMHTLFEYEGLKVLQSPVVEQLVQETVAARLPPYMRPNATLLVESIPKSSSGKADVRRLKAVFSEYQKRQMRKTLASETEALTNALTFDDPIAVIVRDLVCEISHTAPTSVSPETSIFFLGIDSLASFALCRRLRAQGLSISMSQILKNPTIGGIAAGVQKVAAAHTTDPAADSFRQLFTEQLAGINRIGIAEALKTDASSIEDTYPVTPVQEGLLTEALADPTGRAFYDLIVIRATQPEATNQLKEAWHDIVSAHPILRTGFVEVPRSLEAPWKLLQLVWTSEQCAASFSEVAIDSEDALDIITQELQESLTLTLDNLHIPPVHMRHVRVTSNGASWLLLKIHHAVYDGWSVPLLLRELKGLSYHCSSVQDRSTDLRHRAHRWHLSDFT